MPGLPSTTLSNLSETTTTDGRTISPAGHFGRRRRDGRAQHEMTTIARGKIDGGIASFARVSFFFSFPWIEMRLLGDHHHVDVYVEWTDEA